MKTFRHLCTALLLLCSIAVEAYDFEVDGIYYNITDEQNLTVEVTYSGSSPYYSNSYKGKLVIPCTTTYEGVIYTVTGIGKEAFKITSLSSLTISKNITSIANNIFYLNPNLEYSQSFTEIIVEEGNPRYDSRDNCNAIIETATNRLLYGCNSTVIPESVTSIVDYAFAYCNELTNATIPDGVTSIGQYAFHRCTQLACITIGNGVESIGDAAFYSCTGLTNVTIGSGISSIGEYAFRNTNLKELTINAVNAPSLGDKVFYDTPSSYHKTLNIPEGSTASYLKWAKEFTIPNVGYSTNGDTEWYLNKTDSTAYAYGTGELQSYGHWVVKRAYIEGEFTSISNNCFDDRSVFYSSEYLEEVYFPESLTSIGDYAFNECSKLKKICFPESLTSIGDYAFNECHNLNNVFFPINLSSIGDYAFYNTPIEFVVIPQFVTSIGNHTFAPYDFYNYDKEEQISGLTTLVFKSFVAPTMGEFDSMLSLCIPVGANNYPTGKFNNVYYYESQQECYINNNKMIVFGNADAVLANSNINNYNVADVTSITFTPDATGYNQISILPNLTSVDVLTYNMADGHLYTIEGSNAIFKYKEEQAEETILVAGCAATVIPGSTTLIEDNAFYDCTGLTSIEIPGNVKSIGYSAFYGCTGLKAVEIPGSVYSIGTSVFENCTGLASVTVPNNVKEMGWYAFKGCTGLTDAVVNCNIGGNAFENCTHLKNLTIGKDVESVSSGNFSGCTALTNITVDSENAKYDSRSNCNAIIETAGNRLILASKSTVIPSSVTAIGGGAFTACADMDITIPSTVTSIVSNAFKDTRRLYFESEEPATITGNIFGWGAAYVPSAAYDTYCNADVWSEYKDKIVTTELADRYVEATSVEGRSGVFEEIGEDNLEKVVRLKVKGAINSYDMIVFRDKMPLLNELDLSEATVVASSKTFYNNKYCTGNNSLGGYAFYNTELLKLTSVKLPKDLEILGDYAFNGCSKLESVDASATAALNIGARAFENCPKLTEFVSPEKISEVGNYAFKDCNKLEEIELNDITGSIGMKAFENCSRLETIHIGSIGGNIQQYAFYNCSSLEDIKVGTMDGNLNDNAFGYCRALKSVEFAQGPARIGSNLFNYSNSMESFVAGEGLIEIANRAFYADTTVTYSYGITQTVNIPRENLKKVTLPQSVQSIGKEAFYNCPSLSDFTMPQGVTNIGEWAFYNCRALNNIIIPNGVTELADYAFYGCVSLKDVTFPDALTTIGKRTFSVCGFKSLKLPPTVTTIKEEAFLSCGSLTELHIPSAMENIGEAAFKNCSRLNAIYTYTVEPTIITETTFSTFTSATLYVPATSYQNYYWDNGWSRFDSKKFQEFNEPYEYFYLNYDYYLDSSTGYIEGTPDADLRPGSGLVVEGDESSEEPKQNLGDVNIGSDGEGNSASIIGDHNLHIENLHVKINVKGGRWYFFAFPWDVDLSKITMQNGNDYVFRHYDGEERAKNGKGGWKNVSESHLKAARGYIFQSSADDVLVLSIEDVKFKKEDKYNELVTHTSENLNDASWNLMGNPYLSYYDMAAMDYSAPVTVWDGEKYVAIRPGDDDYQFAPYEAFFVQKPEGKDNVGFRGDDRMTKTQAETAKAQQAKARRTRGIDPQRLIVNLVLGIDSITDRTRVVFNERQSHNYETACDAAKFESAGVPQLYTLDNEGVRYSINERPVGNGVVPIGYTAVSNGYYTIEAARMDTPVFLYDAVNKITHNLEEGSYTFYSDKGTFDSRFSLGIRSGETTGVEKLDIEQTVEAVEGGILFKGNATANVYNASGMLVAVQNGAGMLQMPAGTYVVCIGGNNKKVVVK